MNDKQDMHLMPDPIPLGILNVAQRDSDGRHDRIANERSEGQTAKLRRDQCLLLVSVLGSGEGGRRQLNGLVTDFSRNLWNRFRTGRILTGDDQARRRDDRQAEPEDQTFSADRTDQLANPG